MCGIWALFGYKPSDCFKLCSKLSMEHRGSDYFRIESIPDFKNCCLTSHRLAILDLVFGQQPYRVKDYPYTFLILNGEIYNYELLKKTYPECEGEILIHLYHKFGIKKMLQLLDGVFAMCLFDGENEVIHVARDTFGVRPVFYVENSNGNLAVCSEAKGLVHLVSSNSIDEKVHVIKIGTFRSYKVNKNSGVVKFIGEESFSDIDTMPPYDSGVQLTDDIKENIQYLLIEAVRKRLQSDRRIGCLLSGRFDSTLITSLVVKLAKEESNSITYPIQTFTVGMEGSRAIINARKVANLLKTEHYELIITNDEVCQAIEKTIFNLESYDPKTIQSGIPIYLLGKFIAEKTDTIVLLSGEGADEMAQGYDYFKHIPSKDIADDHSRSLLKELHIYDILKADRVTGVSGFELRVPFLDKSFVAYYLSLPAELRHQKHDLDKDLLRSSFKEKNILPNDVIWSKKENFLDAISNIENSICNVLCNHCEMLVNDEDFKRADKIYQFNTPLTKEAFYYRRVFENSYPGHEHLIPHFSMPKWQDNTTITK